jgi:hypothetical protein
MTNNKIKKLAKIKEINKRSDVYLNRDLVIIVTIVLN